MIPFTQDSPASAELVSLVQRLSFQRDMDGVMALVRGAARTLTGARRHLRPARRRHLFLCRRGRHRPALEGAAVSLQACISGWVMLNQQPAIIEDVYGDPRIPHGVYRSTFVKSLVMMPVRSEDPIAAIGAYWACRRRPTDAEVGLLHAVAQAAAVAHINARLCQLPQRSALEQAEHALAERREAMGAPGPHSRPWNGPTTTCA